MDGKTNAGGWNFTSDRRRLLSVGEGQKIFAMQISVVEKNIHYLQRQFCKKTGIDGKVGVLFAGAKARGEVTIMPLTPHFNLTGNLLINIQHCFPGRY